MNNGHTVATNRCKKKSDQPPVTVLINVQASGKSTGKVKIFANHYSGVEPIEPSECDTAVKQVSTTVNNEAITTTHFLESNGTYYNQSRNASTIIPQPFTVNLRKAGTNPETAPL